METNALTYKRNIIVLGAGHSGTRYLVSILQSAGWNAPDVDEHGEHPNIVTLNNYAIDNDLDIRSAKDNLASFPQPYVLKDPRFNYTLDKWQSLTQDHLVVLIQRRREDIYHSHRRRNETINYDDIIVSQTCALMQYQMHQGPKCIMNYESICHNASRDMAIKMIKALSTASQPSGNLSDSRVTNNLLVTDLDNTDIGDMF